MSQYKVVFSPEALKELRKIDPPFSQIILRKISQLSDDYGALKNNIKKIKGEENLYRLRVGNYRVIFEKNDKELVILIIRIGHRREIYR